MANALHIALVLCVAAALVRADAPSFLDRLVVIRPRVAGRQHGCKVACGVALLVEAKSTSECYLTFLVWDLHHFRAFEINAPLPYLATLA